MKTLLRLKKTLDKKEKGAKHDAGKDRVYYGFDPASNKGDLGCLVKVVGTHIASSKEVVGIKNDNGKREWALLPWREVGQVVDVLTLGAKKYSADNWMHVPAAERRYFEAAMRHITARQCGQINDPETRLPHLAHCICCLLFALWFDNQNRRGHK